MRNLLLTTFIITASTGALNAEDNFFKTQLPGIIENIARGAEQGDVGGAAEAELAGYTLNFLNSTVDEAEQRILAGSNFTIWKSTWAGCAWLDSGSASKTN